MWDFHVERCNGGVMQRKAGRIESDKHEADFAISFAIILNTRLSKKARPLTML
jgi:hypothetical protein